jgi:hypothetical protein
MILFAALDPPGLDGRHTRDGFPFVADDRVGREAHFDG